MHMFSKKGVGVLIAVFIVVYGGVRYIIQPMFEQETRTQPIATQHQDFIVATGSVEAKEDVTLAFEENGAVEKINYSAGDIVKEGAVIVSLSSETLQADVEAQRARLEQEIIRLNSYVEGPEENERTRVNASVAVSEQELENKIRIALASAQQTAGRIENMVYTKVDNLFEGRPENSRFLGNASATDKQKVNETRRNFEEIFFRWREWANRSDASYNRVVSILREFEQDLRLVHEGVVKIYDTLLPFRNLGNNNNDEAFLVIANMRETLLQAIVDTTKQANDITAEQAKYQLTLAQSGESLAGSTEADRLVQSARVDSEREQLRRLELQLAKTQVRAPFEGVVGETFVRTGEFVSQGTGVVRLVSRGGFDLSVDITEVEIQGIESGKEMRAEVEVTGEELQVQVRTVDTTEKRVNDVPVYTVVLDIISDKKVLLRPGMTVDVYVPSGTPVEAFIVPKKAIMRSGAETSVLIERGGDNMRIPVTVGAAIDNESVTVTGEITTDDVILFNAKQE